MRKFIQRALEKLPKLNIEQITSLIDLLLREQERYEGVIDSLHEGVIVTDRSFRVMMINKAAYHMLPFAGGEHEYHTAWSVVTDKEVSRWLEKVLQEGTRVEDEEFYLESSETLKILSLSVIPLVRDRQVAGSIIQIRDITSRKKREAKYRRAENLASLTTLAAGVAHEIKNPLASIGIHLQLMRRDVEHKKCLPEDDLCSYLDVLEEEIERLNGIVVDFLFAVRPMDTRMKREDIHEVLKDLLEFIRYELEEHNIEVETHFKADFHKAEIDQKYLKQALLNIIKNAIGAMPDGGRLTVSTYINGGAFGIDITDTGTGISDEHMNKIFEPYFTTKDFGSGLGLTVVYKVIREHQGDIAISSTEGKGTTFTVLLPLPKGEHNLIEWEGTGEIHHSDSR